MSEEISKGSIVVVESRTWPGSNKPGGVARVTAVHLDPDDDGNSNSAAPKKKYDVSYVLGGKEKGVEEEYVRLQSSSSNDAREDGTKKKRGSASMNSNTTNLHVSTSAASLALSASPLQTPQMNDSIIDETNKKEGSPVNDDNSEEMIMEERRKRKNSIQEDILMGVGGSRNSSYNSLGGAADNDMEQPLVKKRKMVAEAASAEETSRDDDDDSAASSSSLHRHHKTAIWSARKHLEIKVKKSSSSSTNNNTTTAINDEGKSSNNETTLKRWRSHQIAEDYINLASAIVLPPNNPNTPTFGYSPHLGQYPIEQITALGYLTSSLRRPTIIEKWSPYEITTFEAALALHGKHFHQVQKWVKTKNTKEIIEFYYIWKKTSHYRRWKSSYCEDMESVCSSSSSGGEGEDDGEVVAGGGEKE